MSGLEGDECGLSLLSFLFLWVGYRVEAHLTEW